MSPLHDSTGWRRGYILTPLRGYSFLRVTSGEDAGDIVQHIGRADIAIAVVLSQTALDDIDLLLCFLIDDIGNQTRQLDGVFAILEQFQLKCLVQPLVGPVV